MSAVNSPNYKVYSFFAQVGFGLLVVFFTVSFLEPIRSYRDFKDFVYTFGWVVVFYYLFQCCEVLFFDIFF